MATVPAYPAVLTSADWNKKHAAWAKLGGKTDMAKELHDAEEAYHKTPWATCFTLPPTTAKLADLDTQIFQAKNVFKHSLDVLKHSLDAAKTQAMKVRTDWSKNPQLPKEAKAHLDALAHAVDPFKAKLDADSKAAFDELLERRKSQAAGKGKQSHEAEAPEHEAVE